ncbi:ESPR-type extended signal peptide-containing protein [Providencia sp. M-27]
MNNVYKLIWSVSQNAWIVCSELGRKKKIGMSC